MKFKEIYKIYSFAIPKDENIPQSRVTPICITSPDFITPYEANEWLQKSEEIKPDDKLHLYYIVLPTKKI